MIKRLAVLFAILCVVAVMSTGCASKWALSAESPANMPVEWRNDSNAALVRHVSTIRGFKETGTSTANILKYIVFGRTDEKNTITRPVAAAAGLDGRLAIADTGCECVHLYIPSEQKYRRIYSAGQKEFRSPVSVVFDDAFRLYVSDSVLGEISVFDRAGEYLFTIRNAGEVPLQRPTGLSYSHEKKRLYAVDTIANKVFAYTTTGSLVFSFGGTGEKPGEFNFPTHITAAPDGRLYVTDAMNFRVQVFDASGAFLTSFGHHGNGSGDFAMPKGIAVDKAGIIYVVDTLFDNVQLFNISGNFLFTIGGRGTGHGEFWLPSGLFLDDQNKLYVCDTYNQRVQVFQVTGKHDE
jgi:DNA-binding beta-propeller fold protein YncE